MKTVSYSHKQILELEKIFRLNLINSISGYKSANLIGSISRKKDLNLAVFSSVIHLGSNPPYLGMVLRPTTVPRDTYKNIMDTGIYTINHIRKSIIEEAHHTSAKYPEGVSEFDQTGLTPEFIHSFKAPFVKESRIKIAMELSEVVDIKSNDTKLIVGKIAEVHLPESYLKEDGSLDISDAGTVAISGLDTYLDTETITKLGYQRPNNN